MKTAYGYPVQMNEDADFELTNAPCGCFACDREVQPGHYVCSTLPLNLRTAEQLGGVSRHYNGTSWVWVLAGNTLAQARHEAFVVGE